MAQLPSSGNGRATTLVLWATLVLGLACGGGGESGADGQAGAGAQSGAGAGGSGQQGRAGSFNGSFGGFPSGMAGNQNAGGGQGTRCGDGVKEASEACDGTNLGGATCASFTGDPGATGALSCFENCTLNGSQCAFGAAGGGGAGGGTTCGNGVRDGSEACDQADVGGVTCADLLVDPGATGVVGCAPNCTLDGSQCVPGSGGSGGGTGVGCGNGKRDESELCEGNDLGGQTCETALGLPGATGSLACNANCTFNTASCQLPSGGGAGAGGAAGGAGGAEQSGCGDGQKEGAEQCDGTDFGAASCVTALGNPLAIGTLGCHANCTIDAAACSAPGGSGASTGSGCGDGVKGGAEQCDAADLGSATCASALGVPESTGTLSCNDNCTLDLSACSAPPSGPGTPGTGCGDGVKAGAEQCDGADFGGATCATALGAPGSTGVLSCYANCTINASACALPTGGGGGAGGSGGGGGGAAGSAGGPACQPATCQGKTYQCGDCLDNDGDGKVDMSDPDCLGPCDNTEKGYDLDIPGANNAPCKQDCYFDQDSGSGNDACYWDHSCDPLEVAPNFDPEGPACKYNPNTQVSGSGQTCAQLNADQSAACDSFCGSLTPNGCDCFGCCELPAGSGKFVWLGSTGADGEPSCAPEHINDPTRCRACTPVTACLNTCLHCEICIDKPDLPADCLPGNPSCGDGVVAGGEQCDGQDLGGQTCATFTGNSESTGTLSCEPNCTLNGSACALPTGSGPFCGDGVRNGSELCDGADLGGLTCEVLTGNPDSVGVVTCNPNCTPNGDGCSIPGQQAPFCGDQIKNGTEQCDGQDLGGVTCATFTGNDESTGEVVCAPNCTLDGSACTAPTGGGGGGGGPNAFCGDGVKGGVEQCDGTDFGGATCVTITGNPNTTGTLACFPNCTLDTSLCVVPGGSGGNAICGDLVKNGTEQCDGQDLGGATCATYTGNPLAVGTLACFSNCVLDGSDCTVPTGPGPNAICGDLVRNGVEQCDGQDFGGATCASIMGNPNATGDLACFANCIIDSSQCTVPGGPADCGGQLCPVGAQACGLACQLPCPSGYFCLTGCCAPAPK